VADGATGFSKGLRIGCSGGGDALPGTSNRFVKREPSFNADDRGGVICLYDTQLLGTCLRAYIRVPCPLSPWGRQGMPDVPISLPSHRVPGRVGPTRGAGGGLSAWSARRLPTEGYGGVCCAFWVNNPCFGGRNEPISGLLTVSGAGLIDPEWAYLLP